MNLLGKQRIYLFWWPIVMFFLASCEDGEDVALDLQDGSQLVTTIFSDTFTVETSIVFLDTINTTNPTRMLVGKVRSDQLGSTEAVTYSQLSIGLSTDVDFDSTGSVYDSIVMRLEYDYIYGDSTIAQTLEIREVTETIDTVNYYNFSSLETSSELIGNLVFNPSENDSANFVSFRLADSFGEKIFNQGVTTPFVDQAAFANFMRGIQLAVSEDDQAAVLGFNPRSTDSFVTLHYRVQSGDTLANRILTLTFGRGFHSVSKDFSNTQFLQDFQKGDFLSTDFTNGQCYIEAGTGITTKIEFPDLENFNAQGNIVINRAELRFRPTDLALQNINKPPPGSLFLRKLNEEKMPADFVEIDFFNEAVVTQYNAQGRSYPSLRITEYIQNLVNGVEPNNGIIISLSPAGDRETVNRTIIGDQNFPSRIPLRLMIFYTVLE